MAGKDMICRACSIEHGITRRDKKWAAIGTCPYCQEHHILFWVAKAFLYPDPQEDDGDVVDGQDFDIRWKERGV